MKLGKRWKPAAKKPRSELPSRGLVYGGDKGSLTSGLGDPTASAPIQPSKKKRVPLAGQARKEKGG
jgi:hypothetical protein